jgi:methionyl-tRNA formyltransferase
MFKIDKLDVVVFLGSYVFFDDLCAFCAANGIRAVVITSPDQATEFPLNPLVTKFVMTNVDDELDAFLRSEQIDGTSALAMSFGARWIFRKRHIEGSFKNHLVNVHGSRLPFDKGGGGFSWRILKGDRIGNLLIHAVDEGVDTGNVLKSAKYIIPDTVLRPIDYLHDNARRCLPFVETFVADLQSGVAFATANQPTYAGSYYPRLNTDLHGWINWEWGGLDISRFICAFDNPYAGAQTILQNQPVRIRQAHLHGGEPSSHPFMAGLVLRHDGDWIVVATADGSAILIEEVLLNGANILSRIKEGDRFVTPRETLDSALSTRARYGAVAREQIAPKSSTERP